MASVSFLLDSEHHLLLIAGVVVGLVVWQWVPAALSSRYLAATIVSRNYLANIDMPEPQTETCSDALSKPSPQNIDGVLSR
jgi:hypothetical protein